MMLLSSLASLLSVTAVLAFGLGGSTLLAYGCLALILRLTTSQRHYNEFNAKGSTAPREFATSRRMLASNWMRAGRERTSL